MEERDWRDVIAIERQCFGKIAWSRKAYQDEIDSQGARCIVMEHSLGRASDPPVVVGTVWVEKNEVISLGVRKNYREGGYGTRLLDVAVATIDRNKYQFAYLDVKPSAVGALRLYLKYGFTPFGFDKNFYGKNNGAIHMMKSFR
jgi:ribosomal protein S18 acetylase RimI-like enzyme